MCFLDAIHQAMCKYIDTSEKTPVESIETILAILERFLGSWWVGVFTSSLIMQYLGLSH